MLQLPPSALVVPLEETLEADLLAEDGERLRFRHDLLRQAVVETLPRSLRRALQREAVTVLLQAGAAPREVAVQLAESAEEGDGAAVAALREAIRNIAGSDAAVAADLSSRALELLPSGDADRGPLVAETVVLLHRAMRSDEAQVLAHTALAGLLPPHEEADVRLSLSSMMTRPTLARAEENRRALGLPGLTPSVRGRHLAWLAYNLSMGVDVAPATAAAESALAEAAATADLETRVMAGVALACVDCTRGACTRALSRIEDLRRLTRADDRALFAAVLTFHHAHTLALLGRLDDARAMVVGGVSHGRAERDALLLSAWTQFGGLLSLAAGQLSDARAEVGAVPAEEEPGSENFAGVVRMVALCQLGAHTGDTATQRAGCAAARKWGTASSPAVRRLANRRPFSGAPATGGLLAGAELGALLTLVGAWQVGVFVLWRGWPVARSARRAVRLVTGNALVVAGAVLTYGLASAGVADSGAVSAAAGSFVAAGLVFGMLFEGFLRDRLRATIERVALFALTVVSAAGLDFALRAYAGPLAWTRGSADDWVTHASLNAIGVGIILHVAIGRRWPFAASTDN